MAPQQEPASSALHVSTLDRGSPVPLYFQVAQHLERAIEAGALPRGTRLSNEIELAGELGVSRPTMRKAMEYLVGKGLVVRQRGVGTRVVSPKVRRSLELTSLFDDLEAIGQRPTTQVLSNTIEDATAEMAELLGIAKGTPVVSIARLRSALGQPIACLTNYLSASRISLPTEALESQGLYQLLRRSGIQLHSATQVIGARSATAAEARMLGEGKGAALLTMQRTAYDDHGTVVEYGNHIYSGARYSFHMSLLSI
ncbi:MAG: GntR family transcriptional regulator [Pseudonocardiales bacterium]|nr:MAG: GntR family transcriptional regulator [Pseudonocardiales bacterium]